MSRLRDYVHSVHVLQGHELVSSYCVSADSCMVYVSVCHNGDRSD